ncbi:LuxR C-terminal-related transcriptional regulator [Gracilibacillus sp. YIM 98692]|uniref:response regulator transcription factor n=1 Tax=Gracilibacillus sp. YIM 98692 TaxID=2663532 RepID=UPI0013CF6F9D|nr:LuxR C-terminal-related transcriptional regulator [Gracilibacillus sp. YIM 98692]
MNNLPVTWVIVNLQGDILDTNRLDIKQHSNITHTLTLPNYLVLYINDAEKGDLFEQYKPFLSTLHTLSKTKILIRAKQHLSLHTVSSFILNGFYYLVNVDDLDFYEMLDVSEKYLSYLSASYHQYLVESVQQQEPIMLQNSRKTRVLVVNRWKGKRLLTNRELDVLECFVNIGSRTDIVSNHLSIGVSTVQNHKQRLLQKLKADNMSHTIYKSIKLGIIDVV